VAKAKQPNSCRGKKRLLPTIMYAVGTAHYYLAVRGARWWHDLDLDVCAGFVRHAHRQRVLRLWLVSVAAMITADARVCVADMSTRYVALIRHGQGHGRRHGQGAFALERAPRRQERGMRSGVQDSERAREKAAKPEQERTGKRPRESEGDYVSRYVRAICAGDAGASQRANVVPTLPLAAGQVAARVEHFKCGLEAPAVARHVLRKGSSIVREWRLTRSRSLSCAYGPLVRVCR